MLSEADTKHKRAKLTLITLKPQIRFSRLRRVFEISSAARGRIKISKNLSKIVLALHQLQQLRLRESQHKQVSTNSFYPATYPVELILSKLETAPSAQPSTAVPPPESDVHAKSSQSQVPAPPKGAADVNQKPETLPSAAQTLTPDSASPPGRAGEPGMSATSGPLDDQMEHEYSVGTDEAPAPVAKKAEVATAATAVEGTALKA